MIRHLKQINNISKKEIPIVIELIVVHINAERIINCYKLKINYILTLIMFRGGN